MVLLGSLAQRVSSFRHGDLKRVTVSSEEAINDRTSYRQFVDREGRMRTATVRGQLYMVVWCMRCINSKAAQCWWYSIGLIE
jgi:hypothetical protein